MPVLAELDGFQWWMLTGALPNLLVLLAGLVLAVVFMRRSPGPACLVIVATLLAFVTELVLPVVSESLMRGAIDSGDLGEDTFEILWRVRLVVGRLSAPLVWVLMLLAAFMWRRPAAQAGALGAAGAAGVVGGAGALSYAAGAAGQPVGAAPVGAYAPGIGTGYVAEPVSKPFYLCMIFGSFALSMLLTLPAIFMMYASGDEDTQIIGALLACGGAIPVIIGIVFLMILIHKMWAAIQDGPARTTPGKAIGFLFIPLFNFYWVFQVYWGWAVDYNRTLEQKGLAGPRASEGLAMALCILTICAAIPFVGIFFGLLNLVPMVIFFNRAIDGINTLAAAQGGRGGQGTQAAAASPTV